MRRLLGLSAVTLALTACMAGGGSAAEKGATDVRIEPGPGLGAPRATHQLVAAGEGRLLAIGGCVRSGCEAGPASATVDIIAAPDMRVIATGRLLAPRIQPSAAALPDGKVLILGGWVNGRVSGATEIFDPATGKSVAGPAMAGPRNAPTVVTLADGRILIAGGYDGRDVRADAEIFDAATGRMTATGPLAAARSGATGTLLADGRVLVAGGGRPDREPRRALASAELFDPATGRFTPAGTMAQQRYKHGAVRLANGDVLIVGGSDIRDYGGKLRSVERFDVAAGRFVPAGNLADPRFKIADGLLLLPGNRVLVAAGDAAPEIFDVARGVGTRLDYDLGGQWNYMTLVRADARTALLAGGYREGRIEPTDQSWIVHLPKG
ncbi:Kelch repeat-containing protein [Sphingopyxis microcysteis]|uniref:Kelch repeat-containing protein n=1 Tax=Sphingopyxis microcysteis TaxID=2484145 RepID=UPI0014477746|nr:kelch repeat-containing protein [Sphingopyxis microcysteis]